MFVERPHGGGGRAVPKPDGKVAAALERGRQAAGLSQDELWALYWNAGGDAKRSAVLSYLRAQTEPQVTQYNLLAKVINERLQELGQAPVVPYVAFK